MNVQPHLLNLSAYIDQNLEKDLPLSSLAKRVGLSPFHFHRKFGAYFGESLHQHIKRLRLERAAFALVNGDTPVRQIARESGYKTVSAFSHAFSGFAGESPTRYRAGAKTRGSAAGTSASPAVEPAWIGDLPPQPFAFVRTKTNGQTARQTLREAITSIEALIGALPAPDRAGDAAAAPQDAAATDAAATDEPAGASRFAHIAGTSDLYGVLKGVEFRLDVGLDAHRVPIDRVGALGVQTLPGGRYARFDLHCPPADAIDRALEATLHGIKGSKETLRWSQYFLRFDARRGAAHETNGAREYRFFVPLAR